MIPISVKPAAPQIKKCYYLQTRLNSICFPASFTLWRAQLKISMRSAQNLCQIPVQVTSKHAFVQQRRSLHTRNPYTFPDRFKGRSSKFTVHLSQSLHCQLQNQERQSIQAITSVWLLHKHLAKRIFYEEGDAEETRGGKEVAAALI